MAITDTSLEWDAAKQAFKIDPKRFGLGGKITYVKAEDLPEGVELVWDSAGDYKSAKVSRSFIKEKTPELQKADKDTAADVTRGTMEDYQKASSEVKEYITFLAGKNKNMQNKKKYEELKI